MFDAKAYNKKWREEHAEHLRTKKRETYQKNKEKILAQNRAWRKRNREGLVAYERARSPEKRNYTKEWRARNPEKARQSVRNYAANNREKVAKLVRNWALRTKYNLTPEQHAAMIAKQKGLCFICKQAPEKGLVVDHDHDGGKVRALLCHSCNRALGLLGDDPDRVAVAGRYLRSWRKKHSSGLPLG
jgi:hypothetical protein